MPCVCAKASISDNPHDCDAMLHESLDVIVIPNIKLLKHNNTPRSLYAEKYEMHMKQA